MTRKKQETDITLLAAEDLTEYSGVVADLAARKALDGAGVILSITQLSSMRDEEYIAAWIVYGGPMVDHSSGKDHAWRKYIYIDSNWENEFVFDNVGMLYDFLAKTHPLTRISTYRREGNTFRDSSTFPTIFDLSSWAAINGKI